MTCLTSDEKNVLFTRNIDLPAKIANIFRNYGLDFEDMKQEGMVGMLRALDHFDKDKHPYDPMTDNICFASYSLHWIKSHIFEYVIANKKVMKIATTKAQRKLFFNLKKEKESVDRWFNNDEVEAIAKKYEVTKDDVLEMEWRLSPVSNNFYYMHSDIDDESSTFDYNEFLADNNSPENIYMNLEETELKKTFIENELGKLNDRQRDIIESRFLTDKKMNLGELGEKYGVSDERIRQIEKDALEKMKRNTIYIE